MLLFQIIETDVIVNFYFHRGLTNFDQVLSRPDEFTTPVFTETTPADTDKIVKEEGILGLDEEL